MSKPRDPTIMTTITKLPLSLSLPLEFKVLVDASMKGNNIKTMGVA
jgi:hypothetical protein